MTYSNNPETEISRFTCDDFSTSGKNTYYIKKIENDPEPDRRVCVDDIQTANVILRREVEHDASSGAATITQCKTELSKNNIFDILLPDATDNTDNFFPQNISYPFGSTAYRVRYIKPDGSEECNGNIDSTLVLSSKVISILACKYKSNPNFPLTGLIFSLSNIDPRDLGESDDSNGNVLIVQWSSKTIPHPRTYCVRHKNLDNGDMMMSFDLTSGEPGAKIQCRKGHRYDDKGTIEGREYFVLKLVFDGSLISRPPSPVTQPKTRPTPESSTLPTTTKPTVNTRHVELSLDINYNMIEDKEKFKTEVISVLITTMGMDRSRISDVKISKGSLIDDGDSTMITFDLKDGSPSSNFALQKLADLIFNKGYKINTSVYQVRASKVSSWKDGPCPELPCTENERCVSVESGWNCQCVGEVCSTNTAMKSTTNNTTYIAIGAVIGVLVLIVIIAVVAYIVLRRNKNKDPDTDDSEMTYTNSNSRSLEALDRELYSTINKKPKAFHEKSFSSIDKDEDYGEKTGIHL